MKNKITVIIVTYKTNKEVLKKCLDNIKKDISIIIIENSKKFKDKNFFTKKFKNIKIFCTGLNLGYSGGNNFGLNKVKTNYALILSPDVICSKNFFQKLYDNLNNIKNFHLIGCNDSKTNNIFSAGYFNKEKQQNFLEKGNPDKKIDLIKVDWIKGFSILINLKNFKSRNIFDQNYFLFMEEIDLCRSVKKKGGDIYFAKNLIVRHLGFKSSSAKSYFEKQNLLKLKNWHYMWSSFYYYKKNFSFIFALRKMSLKLFKSLVKFIFYYLTFQKTKREKYKSRFLGILYSMLGLPSNYRPLEKNL